jgi:pimeloyl-ACP methyl ester carboxylesterase
LTGADAAGRRPRILGHGPVSVATAVALLLPGGAIRSHWRPMAFPDLAFMGPRGWWKRHAPTLAVHVLRYRYWGWNGPDADTSVDTAWALDMIRRRYGTVPVVLVGNSLGGRAAFAQAGDPSVTALVGIAPWLPPEDPAEQVAGRRALIVHGTKDRSDAPADWSLDFARRSRDAGATVARFVAPGAGHLLMSRANDWGPLTADFVMAAIGLGPMPDAITTASDPGASLETPLPGRRAA